MEAEEIIGLVEKWDNEGSWGEILYITTWHDAETTARAFFNKDSFSSDLLGFEIGDVVTFLMSEDDVSAHNVNTFDLDDFQQNSSEEEIELARKKIENMKKLVEDDSSILIHERGVITKDGYLGEISFVGEWNGMVGVYKAMMSDQPLKAKSHVSFTRSNKELVASNVELLDLTQLSKDEITIFRKHVEQIEAKMESEEELRASIDAGKAGAIYTGVVTRVDGKFGEISYNNGFLAMFEEMPTSPVVVGDSVRFEMDVNMLNALDVRKFAPVVNSQHESTLAEGPPSERTPIIEQILTDLTSGEVVSKMIPNRAELLQNIINDIEEDEHIQETTCKNDAEDGAENVGMAKEIGISNSNSDETIGDTMEESGEYNAGIKYANTPQKDIPIKHFEDENKADVQKDSDAQKSESVAILDASSDDRKDPEDKLEADTALQQNQASPQSVKLEEEMVDENLHTRQTSSPGRQLKEGTKPPNGCCVIS